MSLMILQFDQLMALPVDGSGLTIAYDDGGVFTVSSVAFGSDNKHLEYTGTWSPDDPVNGVDIVNISYSKASGDLQSLDGMEVENFNANAAYLSDLLTLSASLSGRMFYSFDIQQTLGAPLNRAAPEFNTARFSF